MLPGGHRRQAASHGRNLVTDRDLKVSANRRSAWLGGLLAILFLASQNRVLGVFAQCRAQRSLVLSIWRG